MSIQSEIDRLSKNVQDTLDAIRQTGVSIPENATSDDMPAMAAALANEKQDKLTGAQGQLVGFNEAGAAVPQDADFLPAEKVLVFGPQTVQTSAWAADSSYEGYGFRAAVALSGVTADYFAYVAFGAVDAVGGKLAPFCDTYAGGVYIYATEQPSEAVSIGSVLCSKG